MRTSLNKTDAEGDVKNHIQTERKNYKPKTAGNKAFRIHNKLKFMQTAVQKKIGKLNKV